MKNWRILRRMLAYGLSAILFLSVVLLSLYLPDALARLQDGALLWQAHEESFDWAGYRTRAWREEAKLFLLDDACGGGAAAISYAGPSAVRELPEGVEALFAVILLQEEDGAGVTVSRGVLRGEWEGIAVSGEYDAYTYRSADRVCRVYADAQTGMAVRAEWESEDTRLFAEQLARVAAEYNALPLEERASYLGHATRYNAWQNASEACGLDFERFLYGAEAAVLLDAGNALELSGDFAALPAIGAENVQESGNGAEASQAPVPGYSSHAAMADLEWESALDAQNMPIVFEDGGGRYQVHLKMRDGTMVFALLPAT